MDEAMTARRSATLRLGGGMLMVGAAAWLILSGLRGELPGTGQEAVEQIQGEFWRPVHIFTIVSIAVVAAGLALLSGTLKNSRAATIGHAGAMIAVPAGAVLGVGFAVDGFGLAALAEAYAAAPDEAMRQMHVAQADLALKFVGATSYSFQTTFGMAVGIIATATIVSNEYPRWLCLLGAVGGVLWSLGGLLAFLAVRDAGFWIRYIPVIPVSIWMIGLGWLAWQRGAMARPSGPTSAP